MIHKNVQKKSGIKDSHRSFPVVGIGASAGGLEAFSLLLKSLTVKPGLAIVFVQHLAPKHESSLLQLLGKKTDMPVLEALNGVHLRPNNVYVITPGTTVEIVKGSCMVTRRREKDGLFHPVDVLFHSLAKEYANHAIGVVLSGTATDGTDGLSAIKESSGITFAQDNSAKYLGMPQSAIEVDVVDLVLSPEGIAKELLQITKNPHVILASLKESAAGENEMRRILSFLELRFGVDFSQYKQTMIRRRIERRMILAGKKTLIEYVSYLKDTAGEDRALNQDLLINVTSFFRDEELFKVFTHKVLPTLLKHRESSDTLRVWVPGCSTGEEVYSIAIALTEALEKTLVAHRFSIKIFGTDANELAIEKARAGIYPKGAIQHLSHGRLAKFFKLIDGSYQVHKSLREMCVFSPHNFLKDPPFSRMDLISCQNVLIYLDTALQKKAINTFHYALKSNGYLMLGKSETVGAEGVLFNVVEKKHKIYKKKMHVGAQRFLVEPRSPNIVREKKIKDIGAKETSTVEEEADELLLSQFTPASMLVNANMEILRFRGATSSYLEPKSGSASLNLLKMVREELALDLRGLIHAAKKDGIRVIKDHIAVRRNGKMSQVSIEVIPLSLGTYFLVLFRDTFSLEELTKAARIGKDSSKEKRIAELLQELAKQKEQMKSMGEEYEAANEELQSSNEEVLSSNEELQSINEELETSQEELQSTNEELTTINDELNARSREIAEARDYAEAIISTIREPLVILNKDLRVRTANSAFYSHFHVTPQDTEGHLLYELGNQQWNIPRLRELLNTVLLQHKIVQDYQVEHDFPSIGRKVMLLNARTIQQRNGEEALILLVIEDVTEKHDLEERRDEFLSMASHELRTPLMSISGYAQLLQHTLDAAKDAESAELASKLVDQINKLASLITDLFDDTKVKEGKLELHRGYFNFNTLVREAIEEAQSTTNKHKITSRLGELPKIYGDRERLKQVVINLLANAIKYSPDADTIRVATERRGKDFVQLTVQDFGIGVSKTEQQKNICQILPSTWKRTRYLSGIRSWPLY